VVARVEFFAAGVVRVVCVLCRVCSLVLFCWLVCFLSKLFEKESEKETKKKRRRRRELDETENENELQFSPEEKKKD